MNYFYVQRPFIQYMAFPVLLFEISTPFGHIRKMMQQAGIATGRTYLFVQVMFVLTFFVTRILFGYPILYRWANGMYELLQSGRVHSRSIVYTLFGTCIGLSLLNAVWFVLILRSVVRSDSRSSLFQKKKLHVE